MTPRRDIDDRLRHPDFRLRQRRITRGVIVTGRNVMSASGNETCRPPTRTSVSRGSGSDWPMGKPALLTRFGSQRPQKDISFRPTPVFQTPSLGQLHCRVLMGGTLECGGPNSLKKRKRLGDDQLRLVAEG